MALVNVVLLADRDITSAFIEGYEREYINLAGTANNHWEFIELIKKHENCVAVLDEDCLSEDDINSVLSHLKQNKVKFVVICQTLRKGFGYLNYGSLGIVVKQSVFSESMEQLISNICLKVKVAEKKHQEENQKAIKTIGAPISDKVIVIGSSTGGTETVLKIIQELPANSPPILIAQHMPPVFTRLYAKRLNDSCKMNVKEAEDGDTLTHGLALIAPGDAQMRIVLRDELSVSLTYNEKYKGLVPSVDVLFFSAAEILKKKALGVILTGMGSDGAEGLFEMRRAGAFTIGQDKETSIVYGMPKVAYDMGAVTVQAGIDDISGLILKNL